MFSRVAVEFAVRYAEVTEAEVTVAVLGAPARRRPAPVTESRTDFDTEPDRRRGPAAGSRPSCRRSSCRPKVLHCPARTCYAGALAREAASGNYDLVVIGAENRAVQHRLYFGADNERLIRSSPVTVALVVPNIGKLETM